MKDCFGFDVRLTDERRTHILQHPEMTELEGAIILSLAMPQEVRLSRSDNSVRLFYRHFDKTVVGSKWLCVVVKHSALDAFIITAYLTDKLKPGEVLWFNP